MQIYDRNRGSKKLFQAKNTNKANRHLHLAVMAAALMWSSLDCTHGCSSVCLTAAAGGSGAMSTELKCGLSCGTVNLFQTEERPACDFAVRDHVHAVRYSFCHYQPSHSHTCSVNPEKESYGFIPPAASIPVTKTSSLLCP